MNFPRCRVLGSLQEVNKDWHISNILLNKHDFGIQEKLKRHKDHFYIKKHSDLKYAGKLNHPINLITKAQVLAISALESWSIL